MHLLMFKEAELGCWKFDLYLCIHMCPGGVTTKSWVHDKEDLYRKAGVPVSTTCSKAIS